MITVILILEIIFNKSWQPLETSFWSLNTIKIAEVTDYIYSFPKLLSVRSFPSVVIEYNLKDLLFQN